MRIGTLTDPASFDRENKPELSTPLAGRPTLVLDTTDTPADITARRIIETFGLEIQPTSLNND